MDRVDTQKGGFKKGLALLAMLVSWQIWLEGNARVFRNKSTTVIIHVNKIKEEAVTWGDAGAKAICNMIP